MHYPKAHKDAQQKLNAAFRDVRKLGIIAQQDYWCCNTCSRAAAVCDLLEKLSQGKKVNGIIFYHGNDVEDKNTGYEFCLGYTGRDYLLTLIEAFWKADGNYRDSLRKSSKRSHKAEIKKLAQECGMTDLELGILVEKILHNHGIPIQWDKDPNEKINILWNELVPQ